LLVWDGARCSSPPRSACLRGRLRRLEIPGRRRVHRLTRRMGSTQPAIARLEAGRVAQAWTPSTERPPPSA
jgi:predicted transcriptional regulator